MPNWMKKGSPGGLKNTTIMNQNVEKEAQVAAAFRRANRNVEVA